MFIPIHPHRFDATFFLPFHFFLFCSFAIPFLRKFSSVLWLWIVHKHILFVLFLAKRRKKRKEKPAEKRQTEQQKKSSYKNILAHFLRYFSPCRPQYMGIKHFIHVTWFVQCIERSPCKEIISQQCNFIQCSKCGISISIITLKWRSQKPKNWERVLQYRTKPGEFIYAYQKGMQK